MSNFQHRTSGNVHIVAAAGQVQMVMLVRKRKELFTEFIEREAKEQRLKMVINGSFVDLGWALKTSTFVANAAIDPSESHPVGEVIQEGNMIAGSSERNKFYFSQNTCGRERFTTGLGNPPSSSCAAIGGIAPIISDGLPYGLLNTYKSGVPAGAPADREVDAKFVPFLTQKSNSMFKNLQNGGTWLGKTAIGFSSKSKALIVLVQQDGSQGLSALEFRQVFIANDVDNAVFLDGSNSATLFYEGEFLVKPADRKNSYLTVAVGFK